MRSEDRAGLWIQKQNAVIMRIMSPLDTVRMSAGAVTGGETAQSRSEGVVSRTLLVEWLISFRRITSTSVLALLRRQLLSKSSTVLGLQ